MSNYLRPILILPSHLRLGLPLGFQSHILHILSIYHVCDIRSAHLTFLNLSTHILSEEYKQTRTQY